ncbi:hypothetical protein Mapa_011420 [Marchantia paleacea]|nr:hypothetical protein Mapa_011420 [Marchantia paleacea]
MEDSLVDASSIPPLEEEDEIEKPAADGDSQEEKKISVAAQLRILGACLWEKAWFQIAVLSTEARSWAVLVLLAAVYLATDPLGMMAHLMDFYPQGCKPHECLLPVPHVNEWPADPAGKLLNSSVAFHTVVPGPESLAWDAQGRIYTGVADGRVIRWSETDGEWKTFAFISPYWTPEQCDFKHRVNIYLELEHICGRPLGLKFSPSGSLYIADAYFGLAVVGPDGGLATILCNQSEGRFHLFTNDVDVDEETGVVYFTVSSLRSQRKQYNRLVQESDQTGRVLKYEPETGKTTVLLKDFKYPNGIALSDDASFLLIASTTTNRIFKYWLKGQRAATTEEFARLPGYGDNVRATDDGKFFWVALHSRRNYIHYVISNHMWVSRLIDPLIRMSKSFASAVAGDVEPMVIKYNLSGHAVQVLEDRLGASGVNFVSTAQERSGTLWLSSIDLPAIWSYHLSA